MKNTLKQVQYRFAVIHETLSMINAEHMKCHSTSTCIYNTEVVHIHTICHRGLIHLYVANILWKSAKTPWTYSSHMIALTDASIKKNIMCIVLKVFVVCRQLLICQRAKLPWSKCRLWYFLFQRIEWWTNYFFGMIFKFFLKIFCMNMND